MSSTVPANKDQFINYMTMLGNICLCLAYTSSTTVAEMFSDAKCFLNIMTKYFFFLRRESFFQDFFPCRKRKLLFTKKIFWQEKKKFCHYIREHSLRHPKNPFVGILMILTRRDLFSNAKRGLGLRWRHLRMIPNDMYGVSSLSVFSLNLTLNDQSLLVKYMLINVDPFPLSINFNFANVLSSYATTKLGFFDAFLARNFEKVRRSLERISRGWKCLTDNEIHFVPNRIPQRYDAQLYSSDWRFRKVQNST